MTYSQINQRTGPTFVAADGRTTATGAHITILPDVNFGQIYQVTPRDLQQRTHDDAALHDICSCRTRGALAAA